MILLSDYSTARSKALYACAFLLIATILSWPLAGIADADKPVNKNWRSVAIKGYDPVAYFTMGKAVKGKAKHEYRWRNARWRFASDDHKSLFTNDPERYAPRFGGFCTGGLSLGQIGTIDPTAWLIVEDRLFLAYDKQARDYIKGNFDSVLEKANDFWDKQ